MKTIILPLVLLCIGTSNGRLIAQPTAKERDWAIAKKVFDPFVGTWTGTFTLSMAGTQVTRSFEVEQQYWWDGRLLKGLSVYHEDGETTFARSVNLVEEGQLFSEIEQDGEKRTYRGQSIDGVIVWFPIDPKLANRRQIKETIGKDGRGRPVLLTEGFERIDHQGNTIMVIYRGQLAKGHK